VFDKIDPRSPTPIYAQIAALVRVAVAAGDLKTGDGLPSVRALATRLRVNPATVVQAYRELEVEGFVQMRQGAGTFVTDVTPERRARERATDARRLVRELLAESARRGITAGDLKHAFDAELGGSKSE
jgi:GntR family transcriptional regulator